MTGRTEALACLEQCQIKSKEQAWKYSVCRTCWAEAHEEDPRLAPLRAKSDRLQKELDAVNLEIAKVIEETK